MCILGYFAPLYKNYTSCAWECDCLARAMLLLAFFDSSGVIFVLATIGIVDSTFHHKLMD